MKSFVKKKKAFCTDAVNSLYKIAQFGCWFAKTAARIGCTQLVGLFSSFCSASVEKEFLLCHVIPEIFSGTSKLVEFATRPEVTTLCQLSGLTEYIQP